MSPLFLLAALPAVFASPLDEGAATELRYTGTLTKLARDAEAQPVKRFSLYCLVLHPAGGARSVPFLVDERGGGNWSWPERYGQMTFSDSNEPTSAVQPRLLYDHEGNFNTLKLPRPLFAHPRLLEAGATWKVEKETFEVKPAAKVQNRECWPVEVSTSFGRKRTFWIEKDSPLVVAVEERLFMGQGVEFSLNMQLESLRSLNAEALTKTQEVFTKLLTLQTNLKRGDGEQKPELSEAQLALAHEALAPLEKGAEETPFSHLVGVASRDVKLQLQRTDEVVQLAKQYLGQPAPQFTLQLLDSNKPDDPKEREGKITLLHFWDYHGEPLAEPYGQVGYLDHLYSRRRKLGVQVYGIAVDARFGEPDKKAAALRSVGKLKSFMNLGYPIAIDNGELLAKFGDPRKVGAKLPLWVLIDADGKIVQYHAGYFKINPDEGLRALDDAIVKLIQDRRSKEEPK